MKINTSVNLIPAPPSRGASAARTSSGVGDPLLNSMEEIALTFTDNVERRGKRLDQRSARSPNGALRVEHVERLVDLYRLLDERDQHNLEQKARQLRDALQQQPTMEVALDAAGNDPARADILMQRAIQQCSAESNPTDAPMLEQVLGQLREEHGEAIRAGINTAGAIALFSQNPSQRSDMRQLYHEAIVERQPLATLLESLLERFSQEHFPRGLRTLQKALADDLAAFAPSAPGMVLSSMLRGLESCGQLNSLLKNCESLLWRVHPQAVQGDLQPLDLGKKVLRFCADGLFSRELTLLAEEAVGEHSRSQTRFLAGFNALLQTLPVALWKDIKTRQSSIRVMNTLMDNVTRQERALRATTPRVGPQ